MWAGKWPVNSQHGSNYTRLPAQGEFVPMEPVATKGPYRQLTNETEDYQHSNQQLHNPEIIKVHKDRSLKKGKFTGWRVGALCAAGLGFLSLIANVAAAGWLNSHKTFEHGLAELYRDDCTKIRRTNTYIHLLINIVSTLLLGGSNYCMQCLVAPTRKLVDKAHRRDKWLDIGIPSIRNLGSVSIVRRCLWAILVLSSLPLHLMYNSSIYASLGTHSYTIHVMSSDYINSLDTKNLTQDEQWLANITQWKTLDNADCIRTYGKDIVSDASTVIVVTSNNTKPELYKTHYSFSDGVNLATQDYDPYDWICSDPNADTKYNIPKAIQSNSYIIGCSGYISQVAAAPEKWAPFGYPAIRCLSEPVAESCALNANMPILITVIVCNVIKCLIMLYVAFFMGQNPLIVVGDAVESFLNERDAATYGVGPLARRDVVMNLEYRLKAFAKFQYPRGIPPGAKPPARHPRRFAAASHTRWVVTSLLFIFAIAASLTLLIYGISIQPYPDKSMQFLWQLGFGAVNGLTLIAGKSWIGNSLDNYSQQVITSVLVANIPQLVLSILYFNLNGLLTSICLALEWAGYSTRRATLRVSNPKGKQRSSFFLTIPYRYAIPLLIASTLLHWLISQSIFLAVVDEISVEDMTSSIVVATCGYSPMAIIFCSIFTALVLFTVVGMGFPRIKADIPLAGSCSAAISAACHPPPSETRTSLQPVKWGVIPDSMDANGREHCAFSSGDVDKMVEGREYW